MANRPIDAPLPADLPENWTAGQIVAPDGTSVGLSPQHGYNYLMEQVNRAQQGVNAVNEAFENVSGKRTCRVVVGTSTAGWTAADCDFLCDGTDDQVEINQAIALLKEHGGELVLLTGEYNLSADVEIANMGADVAITGNAGATVLNLSGSFNVRPGSGDAASYHCQLRGLSFQKAGASSVLSFTLVAVLVDGCTFQNTQIQNTSSDFLFESNRFILDDAFDASGTGAAIQIMNFTNAYRTQITGNFFGINRSNTEYNIGLILMNGDKKNDLLLSNNTISCPSGRWDVRGNGTISCTNNFIDGISIYLEKNGGLASGNTIKNGSISAENECAVTGNMLLSSRAYAYGAAEISGNYIQTDAAYPAIIVRKPAPNAVEEYSASIVGNFISGGSVGIHLMEVESQYDPDASHVLISDNRIYQSAVPIKIEANWSRCLVVDNLFSSGEILDYGTDNIIRGNSNDTGSGSGMQGPQGPAGQGVPTGGSAGQILAKSSAANYDTRWIDPPEGGGGASGVTMEQVNAAIQAAVLDSWEGSY